MPTQSQNPGNFANNPRRAAEAGRVGGQKSSGNFANNPQRAAEAGRIGGQRSSGNFANNPERAAAAGRVGGQNSHANRSTSTQEDNRLAANRQRSGEVDMSNRKLNADTDSRRSGGGFHAPSRNRDEY